MKKGRSAVRMAALGLAVTLTAACAENPLEPGELSAQEALAFGRGLAGDGGILRLRTELGLTDAQVTEIERIMDDVQAANAPLRGQLRPADGQRPDRATARGVMEQIAANLRGAQEDIRGVLTDEQEAKLRELRPERPGGGPRGRGRGGRGGPAGPGGLERFGPGGPGGPLLDLPRLGQQLGLTEDQIARMREIREQLAEENRPLLEQLRGSGERPRGPDAASNPLIQQIQANVAEATEQMKAVLTAEQTAKLQELRARLQERLEQRRERQGGANGAPGGGRFGRGGQRGGPRGR